jgi:hypothetical protein
MFCEYRPRRIGLGSLSRKPPRPQFRTIQVCLNDLPATLWRAKWCLRRLVLAGRPQVGDEAARVHPSARRRDGVAARGAWAASDESDDTIWFNDPPSGISGDYLGVEAKPELPFDVYRLDPKSEWGRQQEANAEMCGIGKVGR